MPSSKKNRKTKNQRSTAHLQRELLVAVAVQLRIRAVDCNAFNHKLLQTTTKVQISSYTIKILHEMRELNGILAHLESYPRSNYKLQRSKIKYQIENVLTVTGERLVLHDRNGGAVRLKGLWMERLFAISTIFCRLNSPENEKNQNRTVYTSSVQQRITWFSTITI